MWSRNSLYIFFIVIFGCDYSHSFISKGDLIHQRSVETVGTDEYNKILISLQDSIDTWRYNRLGWSDLLNIHDWKLDSTFCINTSKNKLLVTILKKCTYFNSCQQDDLQYIYGVKIEGKWYFFYGGTQVLYQHRSEEDGYEVWTPHTFAELHDLAVEHVYSGYLKRGPGGDYEINDKFFDQMDMVKTEYGIGSCKDCDTYEEYVMYLIKRNWQRRDTTDWEQKRREEKVKRKRI